MTEFGPRLTRKVLFPLAMKADTLTETERQTLGALMNAVAYMATALSKMTRDLNEGRGEAGEYCLLCLAVCSVRLNLDRFVAQVEPSLLREIHDAFRPIQASLRVMRAAFIFCQG